MQRFPESRYYASEAYKAWNGTFLLTEYTPFRYADREDNIVHKAIEGDSWFTIAEQYYWVISMRACGLWWVICDYQPEPIVDPTLRISAGNTIIVPGPATVRDEILSLRTEIFL